jgi:hypothetical protein
VLIAMDVPGRPGIELPMPPAVAMAIIVGTSKRTTHHAAAEHEKPAGLRVLEGAYL